MWRKIGKVLINHKVQKTTDTYKLVGYVFKGDDDKIIHGIYFNIPTIIREQLGKNFKILNFYQTHKDDFYGDRYTIGIHSLGIEEYREILLQLKNLIWKENQMEVKFEITGKWDDIRDDWVMEQL